MGYGYVSVWGMDTHTFESALDDVFDSLRVRLASMYDDVRSKVSLILWLDGSGDFMARWLRSFFGSMALDQVQKLLPVSISMY